jgi:hypothetical protein
VAFGFCRSTDRPEPRATVAKQPDSGCPTDNF